MKKQGLINAIVWGLVLGIIILFMSEKNEINVVSFAGPILILLIVFILVAAAYTLKKELKKQQAMADTGKYDELIEYLLDKHKQYSGKMGYKDQNLVSVANCYNRMGSFQTSSNYLDKLAEDRMDNNLKAGYYALYSSNLYFLNHSLERSEELIVKSRKLQDSPESMLLHALINLELNKKEDAEHLIKEYHKRGTRKKYVLGVNTLMYFDEFSFKVSEKFMLGLYYKKVGEENKAKEYYSEAAKCNYRNYFSDLARELSA